MVVGAAVVVGGAAVVVVGAAVVVVLAGFVLLLSAGSVLARVLVVAGTGPVLLSEWPLSD